MTPQLVALSLIAYFELFKFLASSTFCFFHLYHNIIFLLLLFFEALFLIYIIILFSCFCCFFEALLSPVSGIAAAVKNRVVFIFVVFCLIAVVYQFADWHLDGSENGRSFGIQRQPRRIWWVSNSNFLDSLSVAREFGPYGHCKRPGPMLA